MKWRLRDLRGVALSLLKAVGLIACPIVADCVICSFTMDMMSHIPEPDMMAKQIYMLLLLLLTMAQCPVMTRPLVSVYEMLFCWL